MTAQDVEPATAVGERLPQTQRFLASRCLSRLARGYPANAIWPSASGSAGPPCGRPWPAWPRKASWTARPSVVGSSPGRPSASRRARCRALEMARSRGLVPGARVLGQRVRPAAFDEARPAARRTRGQDRRAAPAAHHGRRARVRRHEHRRAHARPRTRRDGHDRPLALRHHRADLRRAHRPQFLYRARRRVRRGDRCAARDRCRCPDPGGRPGAPTTCTARSSSPARCPTVADAYRFEADLYRPA